MKIVYILFTGFLLAYLALPSPEFPKNLPESIQSDEPADVETPLRKSYFSDWERTLISNYYKDQFGPGITSSGIWSIHQNYPPEEATILIRDQTRSSFLEEFVHPMRESLYVNGYDASKNKDIIYVSAKNWKHKITVKMVETSIWSRLLQGLLIVIYLPFLYRFIKDTAVEFISLVRRFQI